MPILTLAGYLLFLGAAFGVRSLVHYRRTGRTGFVGISGRIGSAEWFGGLLFAVALVASGAAPLAQLAGWVEPWPALTGTASAVVGAMLFAVGFAATLWAQFAMGDSWRIGVDQRERTELVHHGPFAWVRNPIYTAILAATLGLVLLVPSWLSLLALVALIVALELQVRWVEEPYLTRLHGERYRAYAARTGRFLPGVGRIR